MKISTPSLVAAVIGGLVVLIGTSAWNVASDAVVLHRAGNPAETYIAKFDALGSVAANTVSCEEFKGFVEKLSPETGPVDCSPL